MMRKVLLLPRELGALGLVALAMLAAAGVFHLVSLAPLKAKSAHLAQQLARQAAPSQAGEPQSADDRVRALYAFLKKDEQATDWLARLHAIGAATGVQMKSASYRSQNTEGKIVRYEIVLPVSGSYPQIREFLRRSLEEIPVLSLDQLSLKREKRTDDAVQAELRMTLHMVKA
jgi:Tfp pilus assembly protein PilO